MRLATLILASRIPLGHLADMASTHVARSHRRPGGHDLEEAPVSRLCVCLDLRSRTGQHLGGTEDYELILGPIARLHSWAIQPNCARTRGDRRPRNPGAWHGTSATAPLSSSG
ncbi:hypothetical protein EDB83DRAFT_323073 [Lactarius deliciosus]|nr:hypothetical protein EDB83DRAFT_323073 [Lactarius deliciosus]